MMPEDPTIPIGLPVELVVGPGDIRKTSVKGKKAQRLTLAQTQPFLTGDFLNHSILMTFKDTAGEAHTGYRAKIIEIGDDHGQADTAFIKIELLNIMEAGDLRKYPRFSPRLFDYLHIAYGDTVLDLQDISAGGARATGESGHFQGLSKGERINLRVSMGNLSYTVRAEIMRIKRAAAENGPCEIAVAFMEWDRHFLHS